MPTYQYTCTECGEQVEVVQKFTDDPLTVCTNCGGRLRKVFSPVGIVFKGSGFYRTDSRKGASGDGAGPKDKEPAGAQSKDSSGSPKDSGSGSSGSDSSSSPGSGSKDSGAKDPGSSSSSGSGSSSGASGKKDSKSSASAASA